MARRNKDKGKASIKLGQPDRSAPTEQTLLGLAQERNLFEQAAERERQNQNRANGDDVEEPPVLSPGAERWMEAMLWTVSLAMVHFTLDVLVQNQYGLEVRYDAIAVRAGASWAGMFLANCLLRSHTRPLC